MGKINFIEMLVILGMERERAIELANAIEYFEVDGKRTYIKD